MIASTAPGVIGDLGIALVGAHYLADYWLQTQHQSDTKGERTPEGMRACITHAAVYGLTATLAVVAVALVSGVTLDMVWAPLALAGHTVAHGWADRRHTLRNLARLCRKHPKYYDSPGGAAALDQAFHLSCLLVVAVVASIGATVAV